MTMIIKIVVFILGMYLSMRMIAAFYGIIDHWYRIRASYPKVIRGILVWGIITMCLAMLLGDYLNAFLWGMVVFVLIHLFSHIPVRLMLAWKVRSVENN